MILHRLDAGMTMTRICLLAGAAIIVLVDANVFQGEIRRPAAINRKLGPKAKQGLQTAVQDALRMEKRSQQSKEHLAGLLEALRPAFLASPKNEFQNLDQTAVRGAIHRLFMQRYGWSISGLKHDSNFTAGGDVLQGQVPLYILDLFEEKLGRRGFSFHDMGVAAAMLENLINRESRERLQLLYKMYHIPLQLNLEVEEVDYVIEMYMSSCILGLDMYQMSRRNFLKESENIGHIYPYWHQVQGFVHNVRVGVAPNRITLTFTEALRVLQEILRSFGKLHSQHCEAIKTRLIGLEEGSAGCVRLDEFHHGGTTAVGQWRFSEGDSYLRDHGALDETDPKRHSVIVPNYMSAPSNCISPSSYYSVCCRDECGEIMSSLESALRIPEAAPGRLAKLVTTLPFSSNTSRRTVSHALQTRLDLLGHHYEGLVPLNSPLFAQWLHHAYPRECPDVTNLLPMALTASMSPVSAIQDKTSTLGSDMLAVRCLPAEGGDVIKTPRAKTADRLESDRERWAIWSFIAFTAACTSFGLILRQHLRRIRPMMLAVLQIRQKSGDSKCDV